MIHGLTKDLNNMQTILHGINQRLYVNVVFNISYVLLHGLQNPRKHLENSNTLIQYHKGWWVFINVYCSRSVYGERIYLFSNIYTKIGKKFTNT